MKTFIVINARAKLDAEAFAKLSKIEGDWRLKNTRREVISIEPEDTLAKFLDLLLV